MVRVRIRFRVPAGVRIRYLGVVKRNVGREGVEELLFRIHWKFEGMELEQVV